MITILWGQIKGRDLWKLKDTAEPDGSGTMLEITFAMHGSASSSFHLSRNYPIISAGGKNLGFTNGRYLKFGKGNEDNQAGAGITSDSGWRGEMKSEEEALAHLFVTIQQRFGVESDTIDVEPENWMVCRLRIFGYPKKGKPRK